MSSFSDFIQEDPQKLHAVGQERRAHFIQEEINTLSKQEVAEPGLKPISYRSDDGVVMEYGVPDQGSVLTRKGEGSEEGPLECLLSLNAPV